MRTVPKFDGVALPRPGQVHLMGPIGRAGSDGDVPARQAVRSRAAARSAKE